MSAPTDPAAAPAERIAWAIVLHGGAGTIREDPLRDANQQHRAALSETLQRGRSVLERGGTSLDAVETVVRALEDDPRFNAGRGSVFTHDGIHELDASIMEGRNLACGAVAGVRTVKHPVTLARLVMERTRHVMLSGAGADRFAATAGVELVANSYFSTDHRRRQLDEALEGERRAQPAHPLQDSAIRSEDQRYGTVGCVALDRNGDLAAATSTGGLTNKRHGRIGDSPIIGAGTYADNRTCGVSASGIGEEFIRHACAFHISALMEYGGRTLREAAEWVVKRRLPPNAGGVIGIDRQGAIVCTFTTTGMYRAWADAQGTFEVQIGQA